MKELNDLSSANNGRLALRRLFFLLLLCISFTLFFLIPSERNFLIEVERSSKGFSGIVVADAGLMAWNAPGKRFEWIYDGKIAGTYLLDQFPIDVVFPEHTQHPIAIGFLDRCSWYLFPEKNYSGQLCSKSKDWVPAQFVECSNKLLSLGYTVQPKKGVKKRFPYYVPVVNRFVFSVAEVQGGFYGEDGAIRFSHKTAFADYWHEESAAPWRVRCVENRSLLVLNPTAEKLYRIDVDENRIEWQAATGKKPIAMAFDPSTDTVFVGSPQENSILAFSAANGESRPPIQMGHGIENMILSEGVLFAVNPLERLIVKVDPGTGKTDRLMMEIGIPSGITEWKGGLAVSDLSNAGFWRLSRDLQVLSYVQLEK